MNKKTLLIIVIGVIFAILITINILRSAGPGTTYQFRVTNGCELIRSRLNPAQSPGSLSSASYDVITISYGFQGRMRQGTLRDICAQTANLSVDDCARQMEHQLYLACILNRN